MGDALTFIGFLFQLAGITFALHGYRITRRDFGPDDQSILEHWIAPLREGWRRVRAGLWRIIGRREDAVAIAGRAEGTLAAQDVSARGAIGFPPLSAGLTERDAIALLRPDDQGPGDVRRSTGRRGASACG